MADWLSATHTPLTPGYRLYWYEYHNVGSGGSGSSGLSKEILHVIIMVFIVVIFNARNSDGNDNVSVCFDGVGEQ